VAARGRWSGPWRRFAHHAAAHLSSLDPATDREAILRWWCRWREALRRWQQAIAAEDHPRH